MATQTKSVDVRSFAKSTAMICFVIGAICSILLFIMSFLLIGGMGIGSAVTFVLFLIGLPLVFFIIGFVYGAVIAILHNFLVGLVDSVKNRLK